MQLFTVIGRDWLYRMTMPYASNGALPPPKMMHICPTMYTGTDVYVLHSERQIIYYLMGTTIYSDKNFVVPPHLLFGCIGECGGGTDQCGWWENIIFGL